MTISTSARLTAVKRSNRIGRPASAAPFPIAALAASAWRRQPNNCDGAIPARRAIAETLAPATSVSSTSRAFAGRIPGSHKLEGGGDRVRLSRELERDAVDAGLVGEWQRTNAKRK